MKKTIIEYLKGPRPYSEGVHLVQIYSRNVLLLRQVQRRAADPSFAPTVIEELRRLSGLTTEQFLALPRHAKRTAKPVSSDIAQAPVTTQAPLPVVEEVQQRTIRFRERFPFLNQEECPDVLKVLVADMFTAYGRYVEAHARLRQLPDTTADVDTTREVVEQFLADRECMAELEHYRDNGQLLGQHPKVRVWMEQQQINGMTDVELLKELKNATANVSKARAKMEDPDRCKAGRQLHEKWTTRKEALQAEIDRRSATN